MGVKGSRFPYWRRDFCHAHEAAKLLRQLGERAVAFLQAVVASLFGGAFVDTEAPSGISCAIGDRSTSSR